MAAVGALFLSLLSTLFHQNILVDWNKNRREEGRKDWIWNKNWKQRFPLKFRARRRGENKKEKTILFIYSFSSCPQMGKVESELVISLGRNNQRRETVTCPVCVCFAISVVFSLISFDFLVLVMLPLGFGNPTYWRSRIDITIFEWFFWGSFEWFRILSEF